MNILAEITSADRELLAKRWESLFEHEPPPQIHTALMRRVRIPRHGGHDSTLMADGVPA